MTRSIAVHSYKGGTGKTTLTANIAVALALKGRRVGIMDMDLEGPGFTCSSTLAQARFGLQ